MNNRIFGYILHAFVQFHSNNLCCFSLLHILLSYILNILGHIHISQPSAGFGWKRDLWLFHLWSPFQPPPSRLQVRLLKDCIETTMHYDIICKKGLWEIVYTTAEGPLYYQALGFNLPILSLKRAWVAQWVR